MFYRTGVIANLSFTVQHYWNRELHSFCYCDLNLANDLYT